MSLKQEITDDMKAALKSGEKNKVSALRMLLADVKNAESEKGDDLKDEEIAQIAAKQVKKWEEAAAGFEKGGETEKALKEKKDAEIIRGYLPEQLGDDEIKKILKVAIDEVAATSMNDMGKVMQAVMPKVKGRADGKKVNVLVKEMLS